MTNPTAIIGALILFLSGCGDSAPDKAPAPSPSTPPKPPAQTEVNLITPDYDLSIKSSETAPKEYTVTWTVKVPTSGWTMKTESVLVEDSFGKTAARIWVHLEQPGPGDTIENTSQTLTGEHKDKREITASEFSVKQYVRGVHDPKRALYGVVKTIKYP